MEVKRTTKWVLLLLAGVLSVPGLVSATPIEPDIKKILANPPLEPMPLIPARAGWNGPEIKREAPKPNLMLETYGHAATVRAVRAALWEAAVPDPRIAGALTLLILVLRRFRITQERAQRKPPMVLAPPPRWQEAA